MRTSSRLQTKKSLQEENSKPKEEEKPQRNNRKADKTEKKDKETIEKAQKNNKKGEKNRKKSPTPDKNDKKDAKTKVLKKKVEAEKDEKEDKKEDKKNGKRQKREIDDKDDDERKAQKKDEENKKKTLKKDEEEEKKEDKTKKDDKKDEKDEKMVKLITKGGYVVDQFCPIKNSVHVYVSASKAYDATLNQSNVSHNNNKFYIIQVLQDDKNSNIFHFWNRWGRVGVNGQNICRGPLDLGSAIKEYETKLYDKTVKGDYRILDIVNDDDDGKEETKEKDEKPKEEKTQDDFDKSKLPNSVKNLMQLIFDLSMMNNQMKEIGYDAKKMPLGKLSKSNIEKGYKILSDIAECLNNPKPQKDKLEKLSSDFYSYIPHDFGFKKMYNFILDSQKKVKDKLEMLQSLADIQIATKLLEDLSKSDNILDDHYQKLKCTIQPIDSSSDEFKLVQAYVKNTHAATHSSYSLEIQDLFTIKREGEYEAYEDYSKDIPNKMLLWHGSRLTNYVGILSQGLRIAPPEAPSTGYMFGKGVYFADMVSKSANYCYSNSQNPVSCMLLCEVALGNMNEKFYADSNANILPIDKHSTKGCGKTAPNDADIVDLNGVKVPIGTPKNSDAGLGSLMYNEYIVYNVKQVRMKYLIKMKFNYQKW